MKKKETFYTSIVNKYGIASYCDYYPKDNISDTQTIDIKDYQNIISGSLVYVVSSALKDWYRKIYPKLLKEKKKIILISGDSIINNPLEALN